MKNQLHLIRSNSPKAFDAAVAKAHDRLLGEGIDTSRGVLKSDPKALGKVAKEMTGGNLDALNSPQLLLSGLSLEAIILSEMRQPWLVTDDVIQVDDRFDDPSLVTKNLAALERATLSVGRIDLIGHPSLPYAGTGWVISEGVAATNRHVVDVFLDQTRLGEWYFAPGEFEDPLEARLDFLRQHNTPQSQGRRAEITDVLYVAGPREPDFALVKIKHLDKKVAPMVLSKSRTKKRTPVAWVWWTI